jgi:hypothetical protein
VAEERSGQASKATRWGKAAFVAFFFVLAPLRLVDRFTSFDLHILWLGAAFVVATALLGLLFHDDADR